jgi:hypothetical protein
MAGVSHNLLAIIKADPIADAIPENLTRRYHPADMPALIKEFIAHPDRAYGGPALRRGQGRVCGEALPCLCRGHHHHALVRAVGRQRVQDGALVRHPIRSPRSRLG